MPEWIQWLNESWKLIIVPAVVFAVFIIGGLWLRRVLYDKFNRWASRTTKTGLALFVAKLHGPFLFWFILLGAYVAIEISVLSLEIAGVINTALLSLFVASWIWVAVSFSSDIGRLYLPRLRQYLAKARAPQPPTRLAINGLRTVFIVIGSAILISIWELPNVTGLLALATALTIGILALRETATGLSKRFHFSYRTQRRLKSLGKVLLSMFVVMGVADIIRRIYLLSSSGLDTTVSLIILFLEMGFVIWFIHILRSSNLRRAKPSFKLVTALFMMTFVILAFSGVQPLAGYKDNLIGSYEAAQAERVAQVEAEEAARVAQEEKAAAARAQQEAADATAKAEAEAQELAKAERETFRLINAERGYAGVPPTEWDDELYKLSKAHTQAMADRGECFHSYEYGDVSYGENAWGGESSYHCSAEELPVAIVSGWKLSPLHWACLLHAPVKRVAVSMVITPTGQYASWTFWRSEFGEGPEILQRAVKLWQAETGESIPWLDWLDSKGYPYNTEWLYR